MRRGIKGMAADNLIKDVLKEKICPEDLSKLILHGAGTWLMVNCKEYKFHIFIFVCCWLHTVDWINIYLSLIW